MSEQDGPAQPGPPAEPGPGLPGLPQPGLPGPLRPAGVPAAPGPPDLPGKTDFPGAFCGYLASLGGPGPYIGGVIALLDLLIMLMLFFGLRPEHLTETSRARKRRLSACGPD